jgi:hypothetical protein
VSLVIKERARSNCCFSGIRAVPFVIPERKRSNSFYSQGIAVSFFIQERKNKPLLLFGMKSCIHCCSERKRNNSCYLG